MSKDNQEKVWWLNRDEIQLTNQEFKEFNKQSRKMERELSKAAEAGLFLTAADLRNE